MLGERKVVRGLSTLGALLCAALSAVACQDAGPTELPITVDAQFAKGGNGGGGGDPVPTTITLGGGLVTLTAQAGFVASDQRSIGFSGQPHATNDCIPPTSTACFESALSLRAGVEAAEGADTDGYPLCDVDRRMPESEARFLMDKLDNANQERWAFDGGHNRQRGTGELRTTWYESGDPNRYFFQHLFDNVTEAVSGGVTTLTYHDGQVLLRGTGYKPVECDFSGTITVTLGDDEPEPPI